MLFLSHHKPARFTPWVLLTFFAIVSCGGGGGGGSAPPAANPAGYYDITGTATVKEDNNTVDLPITDLQAMVNGDQLVVMSVANDLLYIGTINTISGNNYTASVDIYRAETKIGTATISGTITEGSSITGTLTGTGAGNGSFSLTFAVNPGAAALAKVAFLWETNLANSLQKAAIDIDNAGAGTVLGGSLGTGLFLDCLVTGGSITPIAQYTT